MDKKYRLTDESKEFLGRTLYHIQALKDFGNVKAGDVGGWVQSEHNLSQAGSCRVYDDAIVMESAIVSGPAIVKDLAIVQDSAIVKDSAIVRGSAVVYSSTIVKDSAIVQDSAIVSGYSVIGGNAIIKSNAYVFDTVVDGKAVIGKNGYITDLACYFVVENIGSRYDTITFYLDKDKNIWVNTGCFNDTLEAFKRKVIKTHGINKCAKEYRAAIQLAKIRLL